MSTEETPFGVISSMETIPLPTIGMDVKEWDERHRKAKRAQRSCSGQHPAPSNQHATNVASSVEGYGYESLDVAETKNEFERLKGECEQRAGKIAEARVTMEESLLQIARMQALLSQRGKDRMKVLKQAGLPSWTKWATEYAKKINYTMRTLQREIKALSAPRKEACPQCGRKSGHRTTCPEYVETPQRLTPLEAKLLGTAAAAHDAITYIEAGRIDQAIEHLRRHTPTMERIEDYIERGVKPTLLNPDGDAPEPHAATKAPGAPKDGAAPTMSAWRKFHSDFRGGGTCKLKYMEDASNALTDAFESGLSNMRTAKVLEILESKPELARKNADDFRQIAIALRWMAQDCEMLDAV